MTRIHSLARLLVGSGVLLATAGAAAHPGTDGVVHDGLAAGFLHPFFGLDHLAAMLALGLWAGTRAAGAPTRVLAAPGVFAAAMLAGAALTAAGFALPAVEPMVAASLLVAGIALAARRAPAGAVATMLAAVFGVVHGAAHALELTGPAAIAGMLAGSAVLLATGTGLGARLRAGSARWARAAGLLTAGLGAGLLATLARA